MAPEAQATAEKPIVGEEERVGAPNAPAPVAIAVDAWSALSSAEFDIEGQDQLATIRQQFPTEPTEDADRRKLQVRWDQFLKDVRIRVGTLLKTDSISFLLGAGASKDAGGVLIGSVPLEVERLLLAEGANDQKVSAWLQLLYVALKHESNDGASPAEIPLERQDILKRRDNLATATPLPVNFERVLSRLHRWRAALPREGGRLRLDGPPPLEADGRLLDECLKQTKGALARCCVLPTPGALPAPLRSYTEFLKKLLTRPLNLKRVNLFTLNYDTLVEQAADAEGVVLLDGFVGTIQRIFRPESYDQDLYFPAETTEGRVHRLDRVLHLYKLHGSINWKATEPDWDNPYGVSIGAGGSPAEAPLIYPTPLKYGETHGMPYAELFRRFAASVVRPQSTLFVIGYGFGDDHVNAIIRQALAVPSFTLVVIDPYAPAPDPSGSFLARLRAQKDRRVWVVSGTALGRFPVFAERVLPDLRDEEILRKVIATHRSLAAAPDVVGDQECLDGE